MKGLVECHYEGLPHSHRSATSITIVALSLSRVLPIFAPSSVAMNGTGIQRAPSSSNHESRYSSGLGVQPSAKLLLDGYKDTLGSSNIGRTEQPACNMNSSNLLKLIDRFRQMESTHAAQNFSTLPTQSPCTF